MASNPTMTPRPAPTTTADASPRRTSVPWGDRKVRWPVGLAPPVAYGLLAAAWTPRGPLTTPEALSAMALGLGTGLLAGAVLRSRWAMLIAPAVFVAVFEGLRLGLDGPTVDGIHVTSTYGIMAFVVGRGLHGMLTLLPMVLGACLGAAAVRRRHRESGDGASFGLWVRRAIAGATAVALVALAGFVARPATTDPIVGADGDVVSGSVAELTTVDVGDHDLALMVRGVDADNPVLLLLAGGPGGSELGAMRRHSQLLENDFVVATLGVLMVQQHPELYRAYVGVGQMVSQRATDRIFYDDTLAWARDQGDTDLVQTLEQNGPPPYSNVLDYEVALTYEQEVHPYDHSPNSEGAGQMSENIFVEEYTLLDQGHVMGATLDVFSVLYPQLQDIDFRSQANELEVPVYVVQGRHEAPGRQLLAQQWFGQLRAPSKTLTYFETSGHRPLWEQPETFHQLMTTVLDQTAPTR